MPNTKFQIAGTELYITEDGLFTPLAFAAEPVVGLEALDARAVAGIFANRREQPLPVLTGLEIPVGLAAILLISELWDAGEKLGEGLHFLTGSHGQNAFERLLLTIHDQLIRQQDVEVSTWESARSDNITFIKANASAAYATALRFLRSGKPLSDPEWSPRMALAEHFSDVAAKTFLTDVESGFWLRPKTERALWSPDLAPTYYYGWLPHIPDRAEVIGHNQVWDHRWALPVSLYTLIVRLTVLAARKADAQEVKHEIDGYIALLWQVVSKMFNGIRALRDPKQQLRAPYHGIILAVADIHSGRYVGGVFDPHFRAHQLRHVPFQESWVHSNSAIDMVANAAAVTNRWWDHVFTAIGGPHLLEIIGVLERLVDGQAGRASIVDGLISTPIRVSDSPPDIGALIAKPSDTPGGKKSKAASSSMLDALPCRPSLLWRS